MTWKDRLKQMALAGGALSLSAAALSCTGVPCGNANPDPCICGRPSTSPEAQAECNAELSCRAAGGVWNTDRRQCERDGGGDDGASSPDGGSDALSD